MPRFSLYKCKKKREDLSNDRDKNKNFAIYIIIEKRNCQY